jgi:dolichyl-diphosphooligosaccharide--protein glycosyltransferase
MLRDRLPENSAIYTWWDFGLAIEAQSGHATFHDGMSQNTIKTWLIARSFLGSQTDMYRNISYITNNGMAPASQEIRAGKISAVELLEDIDSYNIPLEHEKIYMMFTQDMISKYGAIQYIGNWDVFNARHVASPALDMLYCTPTMEDRLTCEGGVNVDLNIGIINKQAISMIDYVEIETGKVSEQQPTGLTGDLHLIVLQSEGVKLAIFVMNRSVYESAFVQIYLLGNYNPEIYEEVINIYPLVRVLHVLPKVNVEGDDA